MHVCKSVTSDVVVNFDRADFLDQFPNEPDLLWAERGCVLSIASAPRWMVAVGRLTQLHEQMARDGPRWVDIEPVKQLAEIDPHMAT